MNAPLIPALVDDIGAELRHVTARLDESAARRAAEDALNAELDEHLHDCANWNSGPGPGVRAFPFTAKCGSTVTLVRHCDEGGEWTERKWDLCETHEALGCKP